MSDGTPVDASIFQTGWMSGGYVNNEGAALQLGVDSEASDTKAKLYVASKQWNADQPACVKSGGISSFIVCYTVCYGLMVGMI